MGGILLGQKHRAIIALFFGPKPSQNTVRKMKTRKPSRRNARLRFPSGPWRPRGPLQGSSRAWDAVKHVVSGTRQNCLCWHHSAEATFEAHGKNLEDVLANFGISGGLLEAPSLHSYYAPVCAPASFGRNLGCRLRAVGGCAKSIAKHGLEWTARRNRPNV